MTEQARRRKAIQIQPNLLHGFFAVGPARYIQCVEGLPEHTCFIGIHYDLQRDVYYLVFESDDWGPVPFGEVLPTLHVQYRQFSVLPLLERAAAFLRGKGTTTKRQRAG